MTDALFRQMAHHIPDTDLHPRFAMPFEDNKTIEVVQLCEFFHCKPNDIPGIELRYIIGARALIAARNRYQRFRK